MKKMFLLALLLSPALSHAQDMAKAKQAGKDLGLATISKPQEFAKTPIGGEVASVINYQGTNLPELSYADGNMAAAAREKAKGEMGELIENSFLRQGEYKKSLQGSFLDKTRHIQANPETYVDWLKGSYEDCKQEGGEQVLSTQKVTCDEYQEIKEQSCHIGQLVEVDAKHNYECLRRRDKFSKVCIRTLSVRVEERENCNSGAITEIKRYSSRGIEEGSMRVAYPYIHVSSTLVNTHFGLSSRHVPIYVGLTPFKVEDISSIQEFVLQSVSHSDPVMISVNGIVIFTHHMPNSMSPGERDEYQPHFNPRGGGAHIGARGVLPVDALKYLKTGENIITIKSHSPNPVNAVFRTRQGCKVEVDHWSEVCRENRVAP